MKPETKTLITKILKELPIPIEKTRKKISDVAYQAPEVYGNQDLRKGYYHASLLELLVAQEKLQKMLDGTFNKSDFELLKNFYLSPNLIKFLDDHDEELREMVGLEKIKILPPGEGFETEEPSAQLSL